MGNLFFNQPSASSGGGGLFTPGKAKREPPNALEKLEARAAEDQRLLQESGGVPEPQPAPLERVFDLLARPGFAAAGAAEELYNTNDVRAALQRAGTEFFSGIAGLKGEKALFGDVLRNAGVSEMGHSSSLLPFLYNETGQGWKWKKGGLMDITGRGAIGFGMDIPFDPLTYMSFGTAPGAGVVLREGLATGIRRFSRAGTKAVAKAFEAEAPEAVRYSRWLARNMGRGAEEATDLGIIRGGERVGVRARSAAPELLDAPAARIKTEIEKKLEGALSIATRELEGVERQLAQEPLNAVQMAARTSKQAAVETIQSQLDDASRVADEALRRETPVRRLAGLHHPTKEASLQLAREANLFGAEVAHQAAISRVDDLIRSGASKFADNSVVRFAGRPLLSQERFKSIGKPVTRLFRQLEELPIGAQIASGMRKMANSRGVRTIEKQVDGLFNETLKKARGIPGALEARQLFRAESRNLRRQNAEAVGKLTAGWRKQALAQPITFAGRTITKVGEYAALHLDDPQRFPIDKLPPAVQDQITHVRQLTAEWFEAEARSGSIDPKAFRENYLPHIFDNADDDMDKLSTLWQSRKGIGFDKRFAKGPWSEHRVFPTLTDAIDFAEQLKREGVINFDLKPKLDVAEVLAKRADSNATILAANDYYARMLNRFGLSNHTVGSETFKHAFPEIASMLKDRINKEAVAGYKGRDVFGGMASRTEQLRSRLGIVDEPDTPQMTFLDQLFPGAGPVKADAAVNVGKLLARAAEGKGAKLTGLTDELKGLYWMGRLTSVKSLEHLQSMMKRHADEIAHVDPEILEKVRSLMGRSRRQYLASYNEPYKRIATGPYKGIWMPQALAEEADRLGATVLNKREVGSLIRAWDFTQDVFKGAVTTLFPAFHLRNHFSNVATTFTDIGMSAFDPRRMMHVAGIMTGRDGTINTPIRKYTYNEIRTLFRRFGMETTGAQLQERLTREGAKDIILDNPVMKGGRWVGNKVENHAKLINFVAWLERGLDPEQAAVRVQRALFDYDQLSPGEREIMRRIFPFYTWTSKNLRLMTEQLLRHPGRISAQLKLMDHDTGPEREMLPEYLRGDFKVKMKQDGKLTYLTGLDLPFNSAIETSFGTIGRNTFQQVLSSLTPALKAIVENGMKRDLWTGRSLEERQHLGSVMGNIFERMPQPLQDFFEFEKGQIQGDAAYSINGLKAQIWLKGYALSRVFSSLNKFETDDVKAGLVNFFTGTDLKEFDLTEQQERVLRNRIKAWERELLSRGVLAPGVPYLPKSSKYRVEKPKKKKKAKGTFTP